MATRRSFIQSAAALAAATGTSGFAAELPASVKPQDVLALVDTRSPAGASFAHSARIWGARTEQLPLDPYSVWYREVIRSQSKPVAVAGFSNLGTLFCLERLGWEQGFRVMIRIEHLPLPDGDWRHHSHAPLPDWGDELLVGSHAEFGPAAAQLALECQGGRTDCTHAAPVPHKFGQGETFVTWRLGIPARKD